METKLEFKVIDCINAFMQRLNQHNNSSEETISVEILLSKELFAELQEETNSIPATSKSKSAPKDFGMIYGKVSAKVYVKE